MTKVLTQPEIRDEICARLRKLAAVGGDKRTALHFRETEDGQIAFSYDVQHDSPKLGLQVGDTLLQAGAIKKKSTSWLHVEFSGSLPMTQESIGILEKARKLVLSEVPKAALRNAFESVSGLMEERDDAVDIACDVMTGSVESLRPLRG